MNYNEIIHCLTLIIITLITNVVQGEELAESSMGSAYKSTENRTLTLRTVRDIEQNLILNELKQHSRGYFEECEVFCLQPDIRLCQCSKEELNKYLPSDMLHTSKDQKQSSNATLPHIYQSAKEKKTCGEYSIVIRKLNIAMQRIIPVDQKDFYFEPTLDFQVYSPSDHSISNLFFWGDWIALYSKNPYTDYDNFLPACIWQIPTGHLSFHSTITTTECRHQILDLFKEELSKLHICIWSYQRFWYDKNSGPCLCCELNFNDCQECYQCLKNNKLDNDDKLSDCLLNDKKNSANENLSCYRCLNIKNPTFNCQSYENFLAKMIQEYQIHNKYQVLTNNQNSLIDI